MYRRLAVELCLVGAICSLALRAAVAESQITPMSGWSYATATRYAGPLDPSMDIDKGACGFQDVSTDSYAPFPNQRIVAPNQWIYYGFAGEEEFCQVDQLSFPPFDEYPGMACDGGSENAQASLMCGVCLEIECLASAFTFQNNICKEGARVVAMVSDLCPCPSPSGQISENSWICCQRDQPHLDMSYWAFDDIVTDVALDGWLYVKYRRVSCPYNSANSNLPFESQRDMRLIVHSGSNPWWLNIAPKYIGGPGSVAQVEMQMSNNNQWIKLIKGWGAGFIYHNTHGQIVQPIRLRLTAKDTMEQLVTDQITINFNSAPYEFNLDVQFQNPEPASEANFEDGELPPGFPPPGEEDPECPYWPACPVGCNSWTWQVCPASFKEVWPLGSVGRSCKGLCNGECVQTNVQCGGPGYSGPTGCCEPTDTCVPAPGEQYSLCKNSSPQSPVASPSTPPLSSPPIASPPTQSPPTQSPPVSNSCNIAPAQLAKCPYPESIICGTAGNDILIGTDNNDCIFGLGGKDTLIGLGGNDYLVGGPGNDVLYGDEGNDILIGSGGSDRLWGGAGKDKLYGNKGKNQLRGDEGKDQLITWTNAAGTKSSTDFIVGGKGVDIISVRTADCTPHTIIEKPSDKIWIQESKTFADSCNL